MTGRDIQLLQLLVPALDASRQHLAEALRNSGVHRESCDSRELGDDGLPMPCSCGLDFAQEEQSGSTTEEE